MYQKAKLNSNKYRGTRVVKSVECLTWFQLKPWSYSEGIKPYVSLCAECGAFLRSSLCPSLLVVSLSKVKNKQKSKKTKKPIHCNKCWLWKLDILYVYCCNSNENKGFFKQKKKNLECYKEEKFPVVLKFSNKYQGINRLCLDDLQHNKNYFEPVYHSSSETTHTHS